jgi:hypothetical protein
MAVGDMVAEDTVVAVSAPIIADRASVARLAIVDQPDIAAASAGPIVAEEPAVTAAVRFVAAAQYVAAEASAAAVVAEDSTAVAVVMVVVDTGKAN